MIALNINEDHRPSGISNGSVLSLLSFRIGDIHLVHGGWTDPIDEYLDPTPNTLLEWKVKSLYPDILMFR